MVSPLPAARRRPRRRVGGMVEGRPEGARRRRRPDLSAKADRGLRYVRRPVRLQKADETLVLDDDLVIAGDNLDALARLPEGFFALVYMNPPFNTGRGQAP